VHEDLKGRHNSRNKLSLQAIDRVVDRNAREMNGDRPSDRLTYHTSANQQLVASTGTDPTSTRKSKMSKAIRMGLTVLEYLQGVREQTDIIFENFTQELVGCKERAYRVSVRQDTGGQTWTETQGT